MRDIEKVFDLGEEKYRARKFSALDGSVVLKFVAEKCIPVFTALQSVEDNGDDQFISLLSKTLVSISNEEIQRLMIDCLNHCDKSLKGGYCPIMRGNDFAIKDLEYDTITCIKLCAQVLIFNFSDFFGEGGLNFLKGPQTSSLPTR